YSVVSVFFFQAEDGIRDYKVTGVQTCALPISAQVEVGPFRDIERAYFDLRWHLDPVAATQAGVTTYDDRYGRFSPVALAPHLARSEERRVGKECRSRGARVQ